MVVCGHSMVQAGAAVWGQNQAAITRFGVEMWVNGRVWVVFDHLGPLGHMLKQWRGWDWAGIEEGAGLWLLTCKPLTPLFFLPFLIHIPFHPPYLLRPMGGSVDHLSCCAPMNGWMWRWRWRRGGIRIESSGVLNSAQFDPWNIAMPVAFSVHLQKS